MVNSNNFLGFFVGFLLMGSGLGISGKGGKALIITGAIVAIALLDFPRLKARWKTVHMLRKKYGLQTHKEAMKQWRAQ